MTEPITLRDAYRFFLPLVFMTELNMISKSVINAALARSEGQNVTLAAFHVGFTLYYALASSTEVSALLTLAYLKTRRALRRLLPFMVGIAVPSWILAQFIAFTPLGDWVFTTFFGVSEAVVVQAKQTTFLLSLSAPVLIVRSISFGLILMHRRTIFITIATVARLSSLGVSLSACCEQKAESTRVRRAVTSRTWKVILLRQTQDAGPEVEVLIACQDAFHSVPFHQRDVKPRPTSSRRNRSWVHRWAVQCRSSGSSQY